MRLLAIDQATTTGYVVFEDGQYVSQGIIKGKNWLDTADQIVRMITVIEPTHVVCEYCAHQRNAHTAWVLGKLTGAIEWAVHLSRGVVVWCDPVRPREQNRAAKLPLNASRALRLGDEEQKGWLLVRAEVAEGVEFGPDQAVAYWMARHTLESLAAQPEGE